ncbi:MAG: exodeoxyribonuclease VII large subunit [Acidobacteria bacterium]|nr:exodeoxyribonuclease VII large subunit [Acidobacteriota bacterium]
MEQMLLSWEPERKLFTVSELNARIRGLLDREFADVWVAGEISGVRLAASGHYYFTLKDEEAQLRCVCFRASARFLRFKPQDGVAVLARGRIDVYEVRGEYQLLVEAIEPQGYGALQVAFEQLKKKLAAEGLFDPGRKRPLPKFPRRIGLVTSRTGAVIQDMLQILCRRFAGLHIRLYPALVQGEGSVESVCRGIRYFSESGWADVLIVARGGGSLEDLWTFNEEAVARAIAASAVPVVSAVGHETDFTIADFVADLRAPTPSAAAELAVCTREQVEEQLAAYAHRLEHGVRYRLSVAARRLHEQAVDRARSVVHRALGRALQRVDECDYLLRERLRGHLRRRRERLNDLEARLRHLDLRLRFSEVRRRLDAATRAAEQRLRLLLARAHGRLDPLAGQLEQLSPLRVLDRGYAIVRDRAGKVIKDPGEVSAGDRLRVRVSKGEFDAEAR